MYSIPREEYFAQLGLSSVSPIPRLTDITIEEFKKRYSCQNGPLILEGNVNDWNALHVWTPQFFQERYGEVACNAQIKVPRAGAHGFLRRNDFLHPMPLSEALTQFTEGQEGNCRAGEIPIDRFAGIEKYFDFHPFLNPNDPIQYIHIWFAGRGTRSNLHWDPFDNFLVQIYGTKLAILYSPIETRNLYPFQGYVRTSRVDPYYPDFETYPNYRKANAMVAALRPGDLLFFPKGWWHQLRNVDLTIGLNCFFGKGPSLNCFFQAATRCGLRQWVTIIRDFCYFGILGREPSRFLITGDPTGRLFYNLISDPIKRRLYRLKRGGGPAPY